MKALYEVFYRRYRAPWDIAVRQELISLVETGRLEPCRAIDLGNSIVSNCAGGNGICNDWRC
jgi:hypothetical protein